jgi:hypothetical protein
MKQGGKPAHKFNAEPLRVSFTEIFGKYLFDKNPMLKIAHLVFANAQNANS